MVRVLVCGGREFKDYPFLARCLEAHASHASAVIHGGAVGADRLAGEWANHWGIKVEAFPARWSVEGRAAGPIRNARMLAEGKPDLVIAFPGGKGTAHMVRIAKEAGVPVIEVLS